MSQDDSTDHHHHHDEGTGLHLGHGLSIHRIEALADGVFAVAMTLLVFNVQFPAIRIWHITSIWDVLRAIFVTNGQGPILIAYLMSFVLLGVYWVSHHAQFQYIRRTDRSLLWINIFFFMLITFIPFTTHLLGVYGWSNNVISQAVVILYGIHLALIGGFVYLNWWYATHKCCLVNKNLDQHVIQSATRRILIGPSLCLIALLLSFFNARLSVICFLLIPLFYMLPGHIDQHWGLTLAPHSHQISEHEDPKGRVLETANCETEHGSV
jgi:uncharacterized membrane protein